MTTPIQQWFAAYRESVAPVIIPGIKLFNFTEMLRAKYALSDRDLVEALIDSPFKNFNGRQIGVLVCVAGGLYYEEEFPWVREQKLLNRVFVNTGFKGFYPVGVSAVVVAANVDIACELLNEQLVARGLEPSAKPEQFTEIDSTQAGAFVLNDGNY